MASTPCIPFLWATRWIVSTLVCRPTTGDRLSHAPRMENGMSWMSKRTVSGGVIGESLGGGGMSVLHRARGEPSGDVPLGDDEQDRGRDRGQHGGGHQLAPLLVLGADVVVETHGDRPELAALAVERGG